MSTAQQDNTVADTLAVVAALREHMNEKNCPHSIRHILREALKSKNAGAYDAPADNSRSNHQRSNLNGNYTER